MSEIPRYAKNVRDFEVRPHERAADYEAVVGEPLWCKVAGCRSPATHECCYRFDHGANGQITRTGSLDRCAHHAQRWAKKKGLTP